MPAILDTCFCPLSADAAIYSPPAFDDYGRRVLAANIPTLIEVAEEEARSFACNAVVIGRTVVTNDGCPKLHANLQAAGFIPAATPLGEFVKAGGSAKCLTLRLDGEDAASWRA
jgi:N-dimethylarginine dimethylaminohydrolase